MDMWELGCGNGNAEIWQGKGWGQKDGDIEPGHSRDGDVGMGSLGGARMEKWGHRAWQDRASPGPFLLLQGRDHSVA